ncbi:MAG: DUF748 domain-containing protein [Bacteroidales bacterium]|nr:DUF748 domain-containing protein [Bacteroidales bacterium]
MKKIILITCATIIFIILACFFIVPPIAKSYIENHSKELTHRKITIDRLSCNIFTGSADIESFQMYEEDDVTSFISFDNLHINLNLLGLLTNRIEVESLTLAGAEIAVEQNGETFNFDDIIEFFSSDSTEVESDEPSDWDIIINDIHLDRSYFIYKDLEVGSEWALRDISLYIPGIDLSDVKADMGLEFAFKNGGTLTTNIKYDTDKELYDLRVKINQFHVEPILPYLQQSFNVDSVQGVFSSVLSIKGSTNHIMNFDVNGDLTIHDFSLVDNKGKRVLAFGEVNTTIEKIDLINDKYVFKSLIANNLYTYYEIYKNNSDNITELFKEESEDSTQADTKETLMSITIKDLQIKNANVNYIDNTLPTPFNYTISDITVNAQNFNPDLKNTVTAQAVLQNSGRLKLKWIGSAYDISNQNINVSLSNLELKPFSPYSLSLFGFLISDGHLSIQSNNVIVNNMLDGANKINIYNPKLGDKNKDIKAEYNLPVKLGLYVLTDKNGKVDLDLPVTGNVESPDFSYKKIIFKTLGNLLVKVASSPFNALKSNSEEFDNIVIPSPYTASITNEEFAKFAQIGNLYQEKPMLKLTITQEINYDKTIKDYCVNTLKKNYYLTHNKEVAEDIIQNELLLQEKYSSINLSSNEIGAFADSILRANNISFGKKTTNEQKAILLYEKDIETILNQDATERNNKLQTFLNKDQNIPDTSFTIQTNFIKESEGQKGKKNLYTIEWGFETTE